MSGPVSVNPEVLCWARTSLGLSQEEVAQRMNKQAREVDTWERGEASPTYIQLALLHERRVRVLNGVRLSS